MRPLLSALLLAASAVLSGAAAPAVGSVSTNRSFAVANNAGNLSNADTNDYEGKILIIMLMTPWCPFCQSNAQAVGTGLVSHFSAGSRGALKDKNDRGVPIQTLLLSTEPDAQWDSVNESFADTNGYQKWGIDANADRNNPRQSLGYYRGGFPNGVNSSNLYDWGNDRRRVVVLSLVRNSISHSYREIILNQNAYSSSDNAAARAAINAILPEPVAVAPAITTHPAPVTINSGATAQLGSAASGTTPTFQWYIGRSGVTSNPISGATSASYTTAALTSNTLYWVRASNSAGKDDSSAALVTVTQPPKITKAPSITTHPVSVTIKRRSRTRLTAAASGTSPTFQWFIGKSGVTTNPISRATSASYRTPALTSNTRYWVRVRNSAGSANSSAALVTVRKRRTKATQPVPVANKREATPALTTATPPLVVNDFVTWQSAHTFPAGQSGPQEDPDHDGIVNLLEFFHGTDALAAGSGDPPFRIVRDLGRTHLIYQQAVGLAGVTAIYQSSPNLVKWDTVPGDGRVTSILETGETREITVTMPAGSNPAAFYQIKVTAN